MQTIENLEKELKEGKLQHMYLMYGKEQFLLNSALKKIKNIFGNIVNGINYIKIDETNINFLISELETPAFGYNKKLIIAKNTGIFKKEAKKKKDINVEISSKILEYINNNIESIKDNIVLVFVEQEAEKNELFNLIDKYGVVCNFEELKPMQLEARIKDICNMYKVNISKDVIRYFVECCGTNMQDLINEIRKLIEFAGENRTDKKRRCRFTLYKAN